MRSFVITAIFATALLSTTAAADDLNRSSAFLGFSVTKHFGSAQPVPLQYSLQLDHRSRVSALDFHDSAYSRPALLDFRFSNAGLGDFRASGVSLLQPGYMLGAEEGGFLGNINWMIVGFAVVGGGLMYAADQDKDDRLDRIDEIDAEASESDSESEEEAGSGSPLDSLPLPLQ